ncbi:MAG TPA: hypothetical protein QGI62_09505 [Anaerolineales bacterium]|jgi:hypothetical protein|nr:hypothetical protein [Anaerolineales bacterium]
MKVYGRTTISEVLGDRVVFRNLEPLDERLPTLDALREKVGVAPGRVPRKSEADYARVIVQMLLAAQAVDMPAAEIEQLVLIGDTRLNDGTAFVNICVAGGWSGRAFIGSENVAQPAEMQRTATEGGYQLHLANRWAALADFDDYCEEHGSPIAASCAVIVDLDKTALGARGRNAHVIDRARVQAVRDTVANLLGAAFDQATFRAAYDFLNQVEYHSLTADNQDYLAYICLILGSGMYTLAQVVADIDAGRLRSFAQFIKDVEQRADYLTPELVAIHRDIYARVQGGDPTPFKAFRYNEYLTTVGCMGQSQGGDSAEQLLADEIVITQEVREMALRWKERGALLFGLSDKPDEASLPSPALAVQGHLPIHRVQAWAVGSS